ncbi:RNA recognition motif domain-containing protein [Ditylenchus destructor]|nr:RNA recognition motif domain-containing protein [Ditylenchus destructor]
MSSRVYIGHLSSRATERDIEQFFISYGRIRDVVLKNGYGFVEFDDSRDAEDAVNEKNGRDICGERVIVELSRRGPRAPVIAMARLCKLAINTTKYYKEYDSDEFLKQAQVHLDQDPPDVLQSGEKMWGAVSNSLSCLFMSQGAKPVTHKIKSTLINLILKSGYVKANKELRNVILDGWNSANLAHKNFYEVIDDYDTYERWLESVTAFCEALEKPHKRLISEVVIIIDALVSSKDAGRVDARISSLSQRSLDFFRYEKMPPNTVEVRALKSYVIKYNFILV